MYLHKRRLFVCLSFVFGIVAALLSSSCVFAARASGRDYAQAREQGELDEGAGAAVAVADLPADIRIIRDVAYGADGHQKFDVYAPKQARNAPVIVMVHGGGWAFGDRNMARVVTNKVKHFLPQGYIFVSIDYRLLPSTAVAEQARDVARAVAAIEQRAPDWGGDPGKITLMGHSAGAHLVALLTASPTLATAAGVKPWRGSVLLDSAAFDVAAIMRGRHFPLYDRAFGSDPAQWNAVSPLSALSGPIVPVFAVCSSRRRESCGQAQAFADKAKGFGSRVIVQREDRSHGEINFELGEPGAYTDAVDGFLRSIGAAPAR